MLKISAQVEWLECSIPAKGKLYYRISMDVMIIPPMTSLTLKETEKSYGRA